VQVDDGVLQFPQRFGLVGADPGPDQFGGGAGQGLVRLVGNGGPVRVADTGPPVPPRVELGEPAAGGPQSLDRERACRGHIDVEDPGEGGLIR